MTVVDCYASQVHYLDAVAGVWRALGDHRGYLWVPDALLPRVRELGLDRGDDTGRRGDVLLVASWNDACTGALWPRVALMEHGTGQTYGPGGHPSYAGGQGRCERVDLFLCPNERVATANREACPDATVVVVGSPRLDDLAVVARHPTVDVGVSFHWNCDLCPETRSTVDYWWPAVVGYAKEGTVLGHGHPRAHHTLFPRYVDAGIPTAARFEQVVESCRVFVADNTSALFHAAALGLGVVVLNAPTYRRDVDYGGRFWEHACVGWQCDDPSGFPEAVGRALAGPTVEAAGIVADLFPWRGQAAQRAADALTG